MSRHMAAATRGRRRSGTTSFSSGASAAALSGGVVPPGRLPPGADLPRLLGQSSGPTKWGAASKSPPHVFAEKPAPQHKRAPHENNRDQGLAPTSSPQPEPQKALVANVVRRKELPAREHHPLDEASVASTPTTIESAAIINNDETLRDLVQKGPISMLQEFVQCSKEFRLPPRRPILTWAFDTRMADFSTLEFRATATFLLGGVAHHSAGAWHHSKKMAQRDSAERALGLFVGRWGEQLANEGVALPGEGGDMGLAMTARPGAAGDHMAARSPSTVLALACQSLQVNSDAPPEWRVTQESTGQYKATMESELLGVHHKFGGPSCDSQEEAQDETAKRVLWYLQCPGYEALFEPDAATASQAVPPSNWASDATEEDALQVAERKTVVMRIQNRLQQALAHKLKPGQGVWEWSYEPDREDGGWPPLCRATVRVPALGAEFRGGWVRGHRGAQLETCGQVQHHLDNLESSLL